MKVVAIGGGGFTHGTFPALDQFCLDQLPPGGRKVGFIGMASDDEPLKMQRFKSRFQTITETQVLLERSMTAGQLKSALADLDMVYVGGGDTEAMVAAWRRLGWTGSWLTPTGLASLWQGRARGPCAGLTGFCSIPARGQCDR